MSVLGLFSSFFGAFWAYLGLKGPIFGTFLGLFGPVLTYYYAFSAYCWTIWAYFEYLGSILGLFGPILECSVPILYILGLFGRF